MGLRCRLFNDRVVVVPGFWLNSATTWDVVLRFNRLLAVRIVLVVMACRVTPHTPTRWRFLGEPKNQP